MKKTWRCGVSCVKPAGSSKFRKSENRDMTDIIIERLKDLGVVCFSIESQWANAIYDHEKKFEYRKQPPSLDPPYYAIFYETSPKQRVTGGCIIREKVTGDVTDVILETVGLTPHTIEDLQGYFDGCDGATALRVESPRLFEPSFELVEVGVGHPPQNFSYVELESVSDEFLREIGYLTLRGQR